MKTDMTGYGRPCRSGGSAGLIVGRAVAAIALAAALHGCSKGGAAAGASAGDYAVPEVLATIGDEEISLADLRPRAGTELDQIETQYQRARSKVVEGALQAVLRDRLLQGEAQRQERTVEQLIAAEAGPGGIDPNDVEITTWYQDNQARLGGRPLETVRAQIVEYLREQRRTEAAEKLEQRLRSERNVVLHFEPYRATMNNEGAPSLGRPGAPVTVVEFSDFQCPFCQRFAPVVKQVAEDFGDKVHVVYRQFPIASIHPNAVKAAEASLCAHEQGKFWELHDLMFAEQNQLAIAALKEKARRVGLDQRRFDSCLESGRYMEQIQTDLAEGQRLGVTGTPATFVNGVQVEGGAVPYETVAAAIQKELERLQQQ